MADDKNSRSKATRTVRVRRELVDKAAAAYRAHNRLFGHTPPPVVLCETGLKLLVDHLEGRLVYTESRGES